MIRAVQELSFARSIGEIQAVVKRIARRLTGADGATFVLRDGDNCFYADEDAISPLWKGQRFPIEQLHQRLGDEQPRCRSRSRTSTPTTASRTRRTGRRSSRAWRWSRSGRSTPSARSATTGPSRTSRRRGARAAAGARRHDGGRDRERPGLRGARERAHSRRCSGSRSPPSTATTRRTSTPSASPARPRCMAAASSGCPPTEVALIRDRRAAARHRQARRPRRRAAEAGRADAPTSSRSMKEHTTLGRRDPRRQPAPTCSASARRSRCTHHEWWDGSGYPRGLARRGDPAERSDRRRRRRLRRAHARPARTRRRGRSTRRCAEIRRLEGTQFSPRIVEAFATLDHASLLTVPHTNAELSGA